MGSGSAFGDLERPARQVVRRGGFVLACEASRALPFFTPEGERCWVDGWDPRPAFPGATAVEFTTGSVFRLEHEGERSLWTVVEAAPQLGLADYVYVVEGSRLVRVRVEVSAAGPASSQIAVTYSVTSLSEDGDRFLDGFTQEVYAAKMQDWRRRIEACLR